MVDHAIVSPRRGAATGASVPRSLFAPSERPSQRALTSAFVAKHKPAALGWIPEDAPLVVEVW